MFDVNVRGPYFLTAALVPGMAARGKGAIVNLTTMAAELGLPGGSAYGATKAALASLTRTWAGEFAGDGICVNSVSPGPTRTEGVSQMSDEEVAFVTGVTAIGRLADPERCRAGRLPRLTSLELHDWRDGRGRRRRDRGDRLISLDQLSGTMRTADPAGGSSVPARSCQEVAGSSRS
jgi:NAD(P)-dependent dehydrogenase (short-subunit alcohol dehydrogenase family)